MHFLTKKVKQSILQNQDAVVRVNVPWTLADMGEKRHPRDKFGCRVQMHRRRGGIDCYRRLRTEKNLFHLSDSFPNLLLYFSREVQPPLYLLQVTLYASQLLTTDSFFLHVRMALFQKPDCPLHPG